MSLRLKLLLSISFFLSGVAGLMYQVLWSRQLQLIFGSTTEAVSVVLATFMAGLGLGAFSLGSRIDRSRVPLSFYGLLEIVIGLFGVASVPLLALGGNAYLALAGQAALAGVSETLLKIFFSSLVLFPPCFLMGATFPALLRAVSDTLERARKFVGVLYALNLFGAVAGTVGTGIFFLEHAGMKTTAIIAAVLNLSVGVAAVLAGWAGWQQEVPAAFPEREREGLWSSLRSFAASSSGTYIMAGLFVSGASTMAYEIIFTRTLGILFGVSAYSFTIVLTFFLLGLGLGAYFYERYAGGHAVRPSAFGWSQLAVAAAAGFIVLALPIVPRLVMYLRQIPGLGFWEILAGKSFIALVILMPVALLAGLGMPLLLGSLARDLRRLGRVVGTAYLINTMGTIAGALAAGFLLIPFFGTEGALRLVLGLNCIVGFIGALLSPLGLRRVLAVLCAAPVIIVMFSPAWPSRLFTVSDSNERGLFSSRFALEEFLRNAQEEMLFFREGRNATVAVMQTQDARVLLVNGHPDASDAKDMSTQLMTSVIPLSIHPAPRAVAVIGFGSGVTAGTALRFPEVQRVDVVEIERAVLEAAPYFHHVNNVIDANPRARLVVDDGRSFLGATNNRYDVVISEPSNVWRAGVANLFTTDFYASAKRVLKPGGIFAQWMQLYNLDYPTLRIVFKTFAGSFSNVQVWWMDSGNILLLGADHPINPDKTRIDGFLNGEFRSDLKNHGRIGTPEEFYSRYLLGTQEVKALLLPDDSVNTDDRPVLEFLAPRGLYGSDGQNQIRLLAAKLAGKIMFPPLAGSAPDPEAFWLGLASMYADSGKYPAEVREATRRAMAEGPATLAHIRAAEIELTEDNVSAAEKLLRSIDRENISSNADVKREYAYAMAHLLISKQRMDEALEAFESTGELTGEAGLQSLAALTRTGKVEPALALAEKLLSSASLGGPVCSTQVSYIYFALTELAGKSTDEVARRVISLARKLPDPSMGFPVLPRLKLIALLSAKINHAADVIDASAEMNRHGLLDLQVVTLQMRALKSIGRKAEALELEQKLSAWSPASVREPVVSPLLKDHTKSQDSWPGL